MYFALSLLLSEQLATACMEGLSALALDQPACATAMLSSSTSAVESRLARHLESILDQVCVPPCPQSMVVYMA